MPLPMPLIRILLLVTLGVAFRANAAPLFYWSSGNLDSIQSYTDPLTYGFAFGFGGMDPQGIALDSSGNFYIASGANKAILKHPTGGAYSVLGSAVLPGAPYDIVLDQAQNLYVATGLGGQIWKFDPAGSHTVFASGLQPFGLALDSAGNFFESDLSGNINKITPGGSVTTFAAGFGASDIAIDSADNVYAVDVTNGRIVRYSPAAVSDVFASGLANPQGLAFDATGNLLVTDYGSGSGGVIYSYSPTAVQTTLVTGVNTPLLITAPVPEPASTTFALIAGSGLLTIGRRRNCRRRNA